MGLLPDIPCPSELRHITGKLSLGAGDDDISSGLATFNEGRVSPITRVLSECTGDFL